MIFDFEVGFFPLRHISDIHIQGFSFLVAGTFPPRSEGAEFVAVCMPRGGFPPGTTVSMMSAPTMVDFPNWGGVKIVAD